MTSFLALTQESQIIGLFSRFNVSVFIKLLQVWESQRWLWIPELWGLRRELRALAVLQKALWWSLQLQSSDKALTECLPVPSQGAGHCQGGNTGVELSVKALFSLVAPGLHLT